MFSEKLLNILQQDACGILHGDTKDDLIELNLCRQDLDQLPSEIGLNVKWLSIDFNRINILPPEICSLENLTRLHCDRNKLTKLPSEIGLLKKLLLISVADNRLHTLPKEIEELQNLVCLKLGGNQLTKILPEIGQLKNLIFLDLSENQISTLPPEIGQLQNLERLRLSNNQLTTLPPEIGQLKNLKRLDLHYNLLTVLPPEIGKLQNLEELQLPGNQISTLPIELGQLENLGILHLSGNPLSREFKRFTYNAKAVKKRLKKKLLKRQKQQDNFNKSYACSIVIEIHAVREQLVKIAEENITTWAKKFKIFVSFVGKNYIFGRKEHANDKKVDILISMPHLSSKVFRHYEKDQIGEPKGISDQDYIVAIEEEAKKQIADKYQDQLAQVFDAKYNK